MVKEQEALQPETQSWQNASMRQIVPLVMLLVLGCKEKKPEAAAAPVAVRAAEPKLLECEFRGTWSKGDVAAKSVEFVVQSGPCEAAGAKVLGSKSLSEPGSFFAEFDLPAGPAYLCLLGKAESGAIVAAGASSRNPLVVAGDEEIKLNDVDLTLTLKN